MENIIKDFIVIGGGMAGTCAAIAAARNGLNVALVQDRPVLGGNASSEIRVWCCGAGGGGNFLAEETGIIGEMKLENLYKNPDGNPLFWDTVLLDFVKREKNIELFLNTTVYNVIMESDSIIKYCTGWQMGSENEYNFYAPFFADCTGDGTIGFQAGAEYRVGRESTHEFGESMAPEEQDRLTLGNSIFFYTKNTGSKVKYIKPDFAYDWKKVKEILSIGNRKVNVNYSGCDYWWFEYGGILDTISNNEKIKEELQKIVYGIWDYIKNSGEFDADNYTLEWISYIPGKRESRRFVGDYILKQQDLEQQKIFEDAVCYGGWSIDTHPSEGIYSKEPSCKQIASGPYTIPFRCLYSKNISNLLFAGRNISTSHIAYASTRVMNTTAMMGHAIGTAVYHCKKYNIIPRDIYINKEYLKEYCFTLAKEDCYIIGMENQDEKDMARSSTITASSVRRSENIRSSNSISLDNGMYIAFPSFNSIDTLSIKLDILDDTKLILEVYEAEKPQNFKPEKFVKNIEMNLSKSYGCWIDIPLKHIFTGYMVIKIQNNSFTKVHISEESCTGIFCTVKPYNNVTYNPCFRISPYVDYYSFSNVINGYNRPYLLPNLWISDNIYKGDTQFIELDLHEEKAVNEIILFFNPDFNMIRNNLRPSIFTSEGSKMPRELIKEYRITGYHRGTCVHIVHITDNYRRYARHQTGNKMMDKIKIEIIDTWGNPYAEVFEVRVY